MLDGDRIVYLVRVAPAILYVASSQSSVSAATLRACVDLITAATLAKVPVRASSCGMPWYLLVCHEFQCPVATGQCMHGRSCAELARHPWRMPLLSQTRASFVHETVQQQMWMLQLC